MARQVLPIVGGIVGAFFGAPQIGFMIGSIIGNVVDPLVIKGPSIGDGQQTTSQEGQPRPIVWGTAAVGGNIIVSGPISKKIKRKRQSKGGPVQETEHLYKTYAIRACEGPADLVQAWEDEKLVYDIRQGGIVSNEENSKFKANFKWYTGSETQMPDPDLESIYGAGNTPAYRGTAYIVFPTRDLTERRGSIPNYRFAVSTSAIVQEVSPETKVDIITQSRQFSLDRNAGIVYDRGTNTESFQTNVYDGQMLSKDGTYLAQAKLNSNSTTTIVIKKWNEASQSYSTIIPLEDPSNSGQFISTLYGKQPSFYNKADDTFFVPSAVVGNIGGCILIYQIIAGQARIKNVILGNTLPNYGGTYGPSYIENFLFNDFGTKVLANHVGFGDHSTLMDYNHSTFTLSNFNAPWPSSTSHVGMDIGTNTVVVRDDISLRLYRMDPVTNASQIIAQTMVQGGPQSLVSKTSTVFFTPGGSVLTLVNIAGSNQPANIVLKRYSIVPSQGPYELQFVEADAQPQPTAATFDRFTPFDSRTLDRKYFVYTVTNPVGFVVYKYDEATGNLVIVDESIKFGSNEDSSNTAMSDANSGIASQVTTGPWKVSNIILDINDRLKLPTSFVDVTDVNDINCQGLVAAQQYTAGNILRKLQETFFFDPSDFDKKLHFIKRGNAAVMAVTYENTVAESYSAERKSAIEYPRKIELIFQSAKIGYAPAKSVAERNDPSVFISGTTTAEVPVVMEEDQAAQVVDKMHKIAWADAEGEVTFSLPTSYHQLVTSDCIAFYMRETVNRLRIEKIETTDGIMNITAKVDRQSAYTSDVTGLPLPNPTPPPPTITGNTEFAYLDIPALVDSNDLLGYYFAGTGTMPAWHGGILQRSDVSDEFFDIDEITPGIGLGFITLDVGIGSEHYTDTTNSVTVQMYNDVVDFETVTEDTLLNEKNAIGIVRLDGSAEILQFRDAELLEGTTWKLSHLIRGRLNSGATSHVAGAKLVVLETASFHAVNSSILNKTLKHRPVSYDQAPEEAAVYTNTFIGRSQIEFPIDELSVVNSGGNLNISWLSRERFGNDINPVRSLNWSSYKVVIENGVNSTTYLTTTPSQVVPLAGLSGVVLVKVCQVNRITGDGPFVTTQITV